jgi:phage terminase small subunit
MGKATVPRSLKAEGRLMWQQFRNEYQIEDVGGLRLLQTACECHDIQVEAMTTAREDGMVTIDRYGQRRPHPMLSVAGDARSQMLTALKGLHLDVEPLRDRPGHPGSD